LLLLLLRKKKEKRKKTGINNFSRLETVTPKETKNDEISFDGTADDSSLFQTIVNAVECTLMLTISTV
jgi:hypothetical protein